MSEGPSFQEDKCNGCGLCVSVCSHGGFVATGDLVKINVEALCVWCQNCELVCPTGAISFSFEVVEES